VAPDRELGIYEKDFAGTVCLLEEREPSGKSENTDKMYRDLNKDNDTRFDSASFLRARLMDIFLGDWDRHEDQWRWAPEKKDGIKKYVPVPRDRDQVFHVTEGLFPKIASRPWLVPMLHDFNGKIKGVRGFFIESNAMNKRFLSRFNHDEWMKITNDFVAAMTDSVLETALLQLPAASYKISHDELIRKWKERRKNLPDAMEAYYRFLNRTVDLITSDKNELVSFSDAPRRGLQVVINKIGKDGKKKDGLFNRIFYPDITKEIRLYVNDGNDSVVFDNNSPVKLRIIASEGRKVYNVKATAKKIKIYGREDNNTIIGDRQKLKKNFSNDSLNTAYVPANPYNKIAPFINAGFNMDDGLLLGASVKFSNQGFRKKPYASTQQISFIHSFSTTAYRFRFRGEWLQAPGRPDIILDGKALAPDNTQNFFGVGNESRFEKTGNYKHYYRTRFAIYQLDPAIRWHFGKTASLSAGPSLQYYIYDARENKGRFIDNTSLIHSYDSLTIAKDKTFAGATIKFTRDGRDNKLLTKNGAYFNVSMLFYTGLNNDSRSFMQVVPELSVYKSLDKQSAIVIADRIGGGITAGKTTFYQSLFLGGQENLLGYRQYRFAGSNMLYNNLEARIKIAEVGSCIVPGQLGIVAFYDAGKVWADGYNSKTIHQGVGGGLYFAPAQLAVLQLVAGYSHEGWYPYITLGLRF
ncbi:MAG: BamA/TamA family outer membrane protein, partial [Chitinophagaceae bacterium]|nr:BamA/TamA family outer membrane protein [Chitinophagaceae bacterium]